MIARAVFRETGRAVSPTSLARMVYEVAGRCKSVWEMSRDLRPRWSGFLAVDEKMVSVHGRQLWFYGAFDATGDVVHWRAVRELTVQEASAFLEEVKSLGYQCRGLVTDLDSVLTYAVERGYAGKPHQYCLKHALTVIETGLGYKSIRARQWQRQQVVQRELRSLPDRRPSSLVRAKLRLDAWTRKAQEDSASSHPLTTIRDRAYAILFAHTELEATRALRALRHTRSSRREKKWEVVQFFERHWDRLMMHHRVPGLPRTNNIAEGFNRQVQRRIKTIESFQHEHTGTAYLNLLVSYLRLKPYTDCRGYRKHLNGKSRLQAAGITKTPANWLRWCLKTPDPSNR